MSRGDSNVSAAMLADFELFQNLETADRESIAKQARRHHLQKGQYVISASNKNRDVFFILKGHVGVCSFSENGKQVQFDQLTPGMMFGELAAIDGGSRSSDCIADSELELISLSSKAFLEAMYEHQAVNKAVLDRLAGLVRSNMQKVFEFSAYTVAQRVRCELLRLASHGHSRGSEVILFEVPTHAEIATRISSHREAVTRELKNLENAGVITWRPRTYVIHDVTNLRDGIRS
ncbi:MAG: Crp/Fnr family transcriptional regulator [Gammaproteobacteria bacterium]|nr:Crp/Fnr family transcriptional regulator [Gammaproteobacteria bacterium]